MSGVVEYQMLKTDQKLLEINLNDPIYGTLQKLVQAKVARNFSGWSPNQQLQNYVSV